MLKIPGKGGADNFYQPTLKQFVYRKKAVDKTLQKLVTVCCVTKCNATVTVFKYNTINDNGTFGIIKNNDSKIICRHNHLGKKNKADELVLLSRCIQRAITEHTACKDIFDQERRR